VTDDRDLAWRNRRRLILIFLLFFTPALLAWLLILSGWRPGGTTNHGQLSSLIDVAVDRINARFAAVFDDQDLVAQVSPLTETLIAKFAENPQLRQAAKTNDEDNFAHRFDPLVDEAMMDEYGDFGPLIDRMLDDKALSGYFRAQLRRHFYDQARAT